MSYDDNEREIHHHHYPVIIVQESGWAGFSRFVGEMIGIAIVLGAIALGLIILVVAFILLTK